MESILVVDDDEGMRDMLAETLRGWGYEPSVAENGEMGLEKFRSGRFSLVITDIRMPKLDGLSLLRAIKKEDAKVPILVVTGYPTVNSAVESLVEGADYYLVKPINLDDLQAKIVKSFEKRRIQQALTSTKIANFILVLLIPVWILLGILLGRLIE